MMVLLLAGYLPQTETNNSRRYVVFTLLIPIARDIMIAGYLYIIFGKWFQNTPYLDWLGGQDE